MVGATGTRRSKEGVVTNALNAAVLITPSMEGAAQKRAGRSLFLSFYSPGSDFKGHQLRMHAGLPRPRLWC